MMEKLLLVSEASCYPKFQEQFLQVRVRRRAAKKKKKKLTCISHLIHRKGLNCISCKFLKVWLFLYLFGTYLPDPLKKVQTKPMHVHACAQTHTVHDSYLTRISGQDWFQLC